MSDSLPLRDRSSDLRFALSDGQLDRLGGEPRTFVPCPFVRLARDGETMTPRIEARRGERGGTVEGGDGMGRDARGGMTVDGGDDDGRTDAERE